MKLRLYFVFLMFISLTSCKKTSETDHPSDSSNPSASFMEEHTSKNSLDWNGTYQGILPCADCEGIQTEILLNPDQTYTKSETYLGKGENAFVTEGKFNWSESGNEISLQNQDSPTSYKVVENALMALDSDGNIIEGQLKEKYRLDKILD